MITRTYARSQSSHPCEPLEHQQTIGAALIDLCQVMRDLTDVFRDIAVVQACGADTPLVDVMKDDRERMEQIGKRLETDVVLYALDILLEGLARVRRTGFPRLVLEMTFVKLCMLDDLRALPVLAEAVAPKKAPGTRKR